MLLLNRTFIGVFPGSLAVAVLVVSGFAAFGQATKLIGSIPGHTAQVWHGAHIAAVVVAVIVGVGANGGA